jgi:hypothetical protein
MLRNGKRKIKRIEIFRCAANKPPLKRTAEVIALLPVLEGILPFKEQIRAKEWN